MLSQVSEKPLDHIEPRSARRGEVEMESLIPFLPCLYFRMLAGGVVVADYMDFLLGGNVLLYQI